MNRTTGSLAREASAAPGPGGPSRPEPSWAHVIVTTVRLWLQRRHRAKRLRVIALVTAALLIAAAPGTTVALTTGSSSPAPAPRRPVRAVAPALSPAARQAVAWVTAQVSHGASVGCDPVTCAALQRQGFPAGNLVVLRGPATGLGQAGVVVATPALARQAGAELARDTAPAALATFGAGAAQVSVRAVAPGGAAAYARQLQADLAARKQVGADLVKVPGLTVAPAARGQLAAGQPDARLIALIATLTYPYRLTLVSFGASAPGAGAGVPLRSAVLTVHGGSLAALRADLLRQRAPFTPASVTPARLAGGQQALRVSYAAPSPFGVLNPSQPIVRVPAR